MLTEQLIACLMLLIVFENSINPKNYFMVFFTNNGHVYSMQNFECNCLDKIFFGLSKHPDFETR